MRKEYYSIVKTAYYASLCCKLAFAKFTASLAKNKSAQRIQLAPKNYVLRQLVLQTGYCQILNFSRQKNASGLKSAQRIEIAPKNCVELQFTL